MKASLEVRDVEYRGVILESETPEEKEVLERIWLGNARVVALERLLNGQVKIAVAPTPQGGELANAARGKVQGPGIESGRR